MICDFIYFIAPCFELIQRYPPDLSSSVAKNISCKDRCERLDRKIPSFTVIKQLTLDSIIKMCNKPICAFPIDVSYDKGFSSRSKQNENLKTKIFSKYLQPLLMTSKGRFGLMALLNTKYFCPGEIQH